MDVVGTTGRLAALAARPEGGTPLSAEEALALVSALARRLADEPVPEAEAEAAGELPPVLRAPEVLTGGERGPVSDVYALTAGLWTMLAGRPPHVGADEDDVPAEVLAVRRAQPPDDVPDLPAPVTALLLRGLAVDPAERPQDANALAEALDDCAGLVDYTRRRELGERYRPRAVTPRLAPDTDLAAGPDVPVGPVTPVDPLPVLGSRRVGRRVALLVAALAVVAGAAALLVPGLIGQQPVSRTTPGPRSSLEVGPAGAVRTAGASTAPVTGGATPGGAASSSGAVPVPAAGGASTGPVQGATTGVPVTPAPTGTTGPTAPAPTTATTTPAATSSTTVPPVTPPTRPIVTLPPATDPNVPPVPGTLP